MAEGYSEVRDFWYDFNKTYCEWATKQSKNAYCPTENDRFLSFFGKPQLIQEYCSMHFHAQNCTQCEDLCVIQNIEPCLTIWTHLSRECCQTCYLFPIHCVAFEGCNDTTAQKSFFTQNPELFYVLVTLLPICGFIGRGSC